MERFHPGVVGAARWPRFSGCGNLDVMSYPFPEPSAAAVEAMNRRAEIAPLPPVFAWITPTGRCNLYCTHCPIRSVPKVGEETPDMDAAVLDHIAREVVPGLATVKIGGNNNGEPVLARNFDDFYQRIQRPGLRPWIITNGTLLSAEQIARLASAGAVIDFSMDAATERGHKKIRGRGYEALMASVRGAVEARARHAETGAQVWVSPTVFRDNLDEMPAVVRFALDLGLDGVRISNLIPQTEAQRYQSLVYHRSEANRVFEECRRMAEGARLTLITPEVLEVPAMQTNSKVKLEVPARPDCVHPWTSVSIDEKGLVHPCCVSDQVLGDLKTESFAEIWNGRRYRKLRRRVNSRNPQLYCRRCVLRGSRGATLSPAARDEDLLTAIGTSRAIDPVQSLIFFLMERSSRSPLAKRALHALLWSLDMR